MSAELSSIIKSLRVGEQFNISSPPPDGSEPPLNDIPRIVPLLFDGPLRVRQVPPNGPEVKYVSSIY